MQTDNDIISQTTEIEKRKRGLKLLEDWLKELEKGEISHFSEGTYSDET